MTLYPGRVQWRARFDPAPTRAIQERLEALGIDIGEPDGDFGARTESGIKLFQTRHDIYPHDGKVGPLTWAELFAQVEEIDESLSAGPLLTVVLDFAESEVGVKEEPGRPNRGLRVDQYHRRVGLDPDSLKAPKRGYSWCASFVYFSFDEGASKISVKNPCVRTAGVLRHWELVDDKFKIPAAAALDNPRLIRKGSIFIVDHGEGLGHTGLVTAVRAGRVYTIEGNTNEKGSREGNCVARKERTIGSINIGFIDYEATL